MSNQDAFTEKTITYLSPIQHKALKKKAKEEGDNMTTYIRRVLVRHLNGGIVEHRAKYIFDIKLLILIFFMSLLLISIFLMQLKMAGFI